MTETVALALLWTLGALNLANSLYFTLLVYRVIGPHASLVPRFCRLGEQSCESIVHSRYARTVADLPTGDRPVALRLFVRRFRCARPDCPQHIFCERLPGLLPAYARTTARLTETQRLIGLALGGEAGARLARPGLSDQS